MKSIQLTDDQQAIIDKALETIRSHGRLCINGPAGTGKTTLTRELVQILKRKGINGVVLAAPTHYAKRVLKDLSGYESHTIHSILKINPTTYEDQIEFSQSKTPDLRDTVVLICDEVSMYDNKLFAILLNSLPSTCALIGLGDVSQLQPVDNDTTVSPFFTHKSIEQVHLTKVLRSNAPIIDVATTVREGGKLFASVVNGAGVHCLNSDKSIKSFVDKYFEHVKTTDDVFNTRLLAFTNATVAKLNQIVRKTLYNTEEQFIVGEYIVAQGPITETQNFNGKNFTTTLIQNGEVCKIVNLIQCTKAVQISGLPKGPTVEYYALTVKGEENITTVNVLHSASEYEFSKYLSKCASTIRAQNMRRTWSSWWDLKNSFVEFKHLPASTIHKAQGSTVDNVFLYGPDLMRADDVLRQQLVYVGITRAKHNVFYIGEL